MNKENNTSIDHSAKKNTSIDHSAKNIKRSPFFIKNIPSHYDYLTLQKFFMKFGSIKDFKPVFNSDMSSIRFIFIIYKEERAIYYLHDYFKTKNFIIELNFREECEPSDDKIISGRLKCADLRNKIIKHINTNKATEKSPTLYFTNREKWLEKVVDIQKIIKKF